ncbi:MAG: leucyl aminopeptidase [Bacteroidales bacterium]|jgi:leucyl aminopeptidase|nr:leucyl aminopeptidase [Bacteroidales bacterium]
MIKFENIYNVDESVIYIINNISEIDNLELKKEEKDYSIKCFNDKKKFVELNLYYKSIFIINHDEIENNEIKDVSFEIYKILKFRYIDVINIIGNTLYFAEFIALSDYSFNKYFTNKSDKNYSLKEIKYIGNYNYNNFDEKEINELNAVIQGVKIAKDIVNEPLSHMTAVKLSEEIQKLGEQYGFQTEILHKKQIESLKMGGLLAVNRGSIEPPTFTIVKYEPENAINEKPIVLVGKGIVFDTGGINLKPSGYLETMKSDKAGAATVVGTISTVAMSKFPLKIYGLIPATENRPGNNAYVPEDIIKMYDGTTVEVLNTDAEGRLILADALAYAKQLKPECVIDLATLTGAAMAAVGTEVAVILGNCKELTDALTQSGFKTDEKLVQLPLWKEYEKELKSSIADMKNIGGKYAGAIIAAKFLEHFTDYEWAHIDIAGPAFMEHAKDYRGAGGTGFGVKLLMNFLKEKIQSEKANVRM